MSYYVHDVPGRLRVKNPIMKGNQSMAREMEEFLKAMDGIHSVNANVVTGSVVVNYNTGSLNSGQILDSLSKKGHFDPSRVVTGDQYMQQKLSKTGEVIGRALLGIAIEKAFEGTPLALLSIVL